MDVDCWACVFSFLNEEELTKLYIYATDYVKQAFDRTIVTQALVNGDAGSLVGIKGFMRTVRTLRLWRLELTCPEEMSWLQMCPINEDRIVIQKLLLGRKDVTFPKDTNRCKLIAAILFALYSLVSTTPFSSIMAAVTATAMSDGQTAFITIDALINLPSGREYLKNLFESMTKIGIPTAEAIKAKLKRECTNHDLSFL